MTDARPSSAFAYYRLPELYANKHPALPLQFVTRPRLRTDFHPSQSSRSSTVFAPPQSLCYSRFYQRGPRARSLPCNAHIVLTGRLACCEDVAFKARIEDSRTGSSQRLLNCTRCDCRSIPGREILCSDAARHRLGGADNPASLWLFRHSIPRFWDLTCSTAPSPS
ncbi:hypothetical protein BD626DRAFT_522972, partial [Schizophyllum amplum]